MAPARSSAHDFRGVGRLLGEVDGDVVERV